MRSLLSFTKVSLADPEQIVSPIGDELRDMLNGFHLELLRHCNHPPPADDKEKELEEAKKAEAELMSWSDKLLTLITSKSQQKPEGPLDTGPGMNVNISTFNCGLLRVIRNKKYITQKNWHLFMFHISC